MSPHWIITPVLLPLLSAVVLMFGARLGLSFQRTVSLLTTVALVAIGGHLTAQAAGDYQVYAVGAWPAPYGIVLVLDRLSAIMVLLTGLVALPSLFHAVQGADLRSRNFHPLFQLQLMGLNGAFLTGDLFNLFVFFEVLLIASYGLLLHGGGGARLRAGIHYVVLNLAGSGLFLVAVGVLYGVTGTLNMADLAVKVAQAPAGDAALLRAAALLLLVVFGLKAALLPLHFWLPSAYSAAVAPVAALFAIMTKVGVYAILRVFTLVFGTQAGAAADVAAPWLLPAAIATLVWGTVGVLSSRRLRTLIAHLVIASTGTLLIAVGLFTAQAVSAAIYYLIHSTVIAAGLFLLADLVTTQRGELGDRLDPGPAPAQPMLLGALFLIAAVAVVGVPPLSGFIGKVLVLEAAPLGTVAWWVWAAVLATGLLMLIALSRAGSVLFWNTVPSVAVVRRADAVALLPVFALLGIIVALTVAAGPIHAYTDATAAQLLDPARYIGRVLGP